MKEAFTIKEEIIGLFKDQKVEASFFDFLFLIFLKEDYLNTDLNTLLPLAGHLVLRNLIFLSSPKCNTV